MHRLKYGREKEKLRKCFSTGAKKNEERSSLYIGSEILFKCLSWTMWDLKLFFLLFFPFFFFKLSSTFSFILTKLLLIRELGIGIVLYSPLGRGFFGGKGVLENMPAYTTLVQCFNSYLCVFVAYCRIFWTWKINEK